MKRRLKCGTCSRTTMKLEDGSVRPLHMLSDNAVSVMTKARITECWDCGKARRAAEDEKKQSRLSRLINDAE